MSARIVCRSDAAYGANLCAFAAGRALIVIDSGTVVIKSDSARLTGLDAFSAGDAGIGAKLSCHRALLLIMAGDYLTLNVGHHMNKVVGTALHTYAASDTLTEINSCDAVIHTDSIVGTSANAVAAAETAEGAHSVASVEHLCRNAGINACIKCFCISCCTVTAAANCCYHFNRSLMLNAEKLGELFGNLMTAGGTEICLCALISSQSLSISVTSGKSAGSAVCAGEALSYLYLCFINVNAHEDSRNYENHSTKKSYCRYSDNGSDYSFKHFTLTSLCEKGLNDARKA